MRSFLAFFKKELLVALELVVVHGIKAHYVKADALVVARKDQRHHLVVKAGIVAKIGIRAPFFVPSRAKKQEIRFLYLVAVRRQLRHRDGVALAERAAIDHQCLAHKL